MAEPPSFYEQLRANYQKVQSSTEFSGDQLWLTFYLTGPPKTLRQVAETLNARGWVNVEGWEGAFLYPKVQVGKSVEEVMRAADATQEVCARHDVEILNIDADTSPDVERSHFVTLYRS